MDSIYLDHNATTCQEPAVTKAMLEVMEHGWANPSSIHRSGQQARRHVEDARARVAALIGAEPDEIVFTSGGSESVNAAIRSALSASPERRLIVTTAVEHSAVRELLDVLGQQGIEHAFLGHDAGGRVDPDSLREIIRTRGDEIGVVSVMWANNETGVIEPVEELAAICHDAGIPMHSDGTQWVGKMPTDVSSLGLTMLSFAGHKFHGPKGTGVLWARRGTPVTGQVVGGGQERGRRGGTENVPGIVGLGVASDLAAAWFEQGGHERMPSVRIGFEAEMARLVPGICINGSSAPRMWSTSNIGFPGLEAELLLLAMSERGVDASAGSACASGALKHSSVLDAIGRQPCQVDDKEYGSLRFSWCRHTSEADLHQAALITASTVEDLMRLHVPDGATWPTPPIADVEQA